jgi:hypothetical protein
MDALIIGHARASSQALPRPSAAINVSSANASGSSPGAARNGPGVASTAHTCATLRRGAIPAQRSAALPKAKPCRRAPRRFSAERQAVVDLQARG